MAYNLKCTIYPNNTLKIKSYDDFVAEEHKKPEIEYTIEPFNGKRVKKVDDFKESSKESLERSLARTRQRIREYARCENWEYFVTFTFAPDKVDRTDYKKCMKKLRGWFNREHKKNPNFKYLCVPEFHKKKENGLHTWHAHAIVSNLDKTLLVESGHFTKDGKKIYNINNYNFGFSTAIRVENRGNSLSNYIAKYITKEVMALSKGAKRYFVSHNIEKPKVITFCLPVAQHNEMIKQIADYYGLENVWISESDGYVHIVYYEFE